MPDPLRKLADDLIELRRYVATDPKFVRACLDGIMDNPHVPCGSVKDRLAANLRVAAAFLLADPEVAANYLYCTAFELRLESEKP